MCKYPCFFGEIPDQVGSVVGGDWEREERGANFRERESVCERTGERLRRGERLSKGERYGGEIQRQREEDRVRETGCDSRGGKCLTPSPSSPLSSLSLSSLH